METMKFLMTDLGEAATAACVAALEGRGMEVVVCPKDGAQVLEKCWNTGPVRFFWRCSCPGWMHWR